MTDTLPFRIRVRPGLTPKPERAPAPPPPGTAADAIRCTKCGVYRPPTKFESKGRRNGVQRRRKTCDYCRQGRPVPPSAAERAEMREQETERVCADCGQRHPIVEFQRCGGTAGDYLYRLHLCRRCNNARHRQYFGYCRRKAGARYRPRGATPVLRPARVLKTYGAPQVRR